MPTFLPVFVLWILHNFFEGKLYIIPIGYRTLIVGMANLGHSIFLAIGNNMWYDTIVLYCKTILW